jgi:solute carrier family 8 (sodium/calcium exchanger)
LELPLYLIFSWGKQTNNQIDLLKLSLPRLKLTKSEMKKVENVLTQLGIERSITVNVWNPTVANLTLMALGSSAPEILLSVIETVSTLGSTPGELGPSTIVGSAAFNLLVISGVSIYAVPTGEVRIGFLKLA